MKFLKKLNRGMLLTLVIAAVCVVYIGTEHSKADRMGKQADKCMAEFLMKDSEWKVIPQEYRNRESEYIAMLEPAMRPLFESDSAYDYYVENNISNQYRTGIFCEKYNAGVSYIYDKVYNNGVLSCDYGISISYEYGGGENVKSYQNTPYLTFSFKEKDGQVGIYYIEYTLEDNSMGIGEYIDNFTNGDVIFGYGG